MDEAPLLRRRTVFARLRALAWGPRALSPSLKLPPRQTVLPARERPSRRLLARES